MKDYHTIYENGDQTLTIGPGANGCVGLWFQSGKRIVGIWADKEAIALGFGYDKDAKMPYQLVLSAQNDGLYLQLTKKDRDTQIIALDDGVMDTLTKVLFGVA